MSIISCLVSKPKNKSISSSEQLFNATDLSPVTFGVIFPPNLRGKNSIILKLILELQIRIKILKHIQSKHY